MWTGKCMVARKIRYSLQCCRTHLLEAPLHELQALRATSNRLEI